MSRFSNLFQEPEPAPAPAAPSQPAPAVVPSPEAKADGNVKSTRKKKGFTMD
jgi:hypothetical protein